MKHLKHITLCVFIFFVMIAQVWAEDASDDNTARDDTQVYHLYKDVDLVSTLKFQYGVRPKVFVKSVFPQLSGDNDNPFLDRFNQVVNELVQGEIDDFKNQAKQTLETTKAHPDQPGKNDLYVDYNTSAIKSGQEHIISVRFSFQGFLAGMAHPYHHHLVLNYNLDTGEQIELSDLFIPDADYLTTLSDYTRKVLSKRLTDQQMVIDGTEPKPENFKVWNIKSDGLLITFDEYLVAPYVNGAQTVLVPYSELKSILARESPIASCVKHKRSCRYGSILTGGFIDGI